MFAANRQKIAVGAALLVLIGAPVGCAYLQPREEVPYTGRKRPPLRYTEQDMNVLGAQAYKDISGKYPVVTSGSGAAGLKRVGHDSAARPDPVRQVGRHPRRAPAARTAPVLERHLALRTGDRLGEPG